MARAPKQFYLTNKDLLKEIHKSKMSYCWVKDEESEGLFDAIVESLDDIDDEIIDLARQTRATRMQRFAHEAEVKRWEKGLTGKKTKPKAADFAVDVDTIPKTDVVIRVMTFDHVPKENRKNKPKTEADYHAKCNFPPFKHYNLKEDNSWEEVARSHWEGSLGNGAFSVTHGTTNNRLASMYMKLCERYSMRGNWRGYTYVDEMRGQALLQLTQIGLQFNEAKSANPFAYYTAAINNSFTRVLNFEKRSQEIRDDLLEEEGLNPSSTRLFNAEWESAQEIINKKTKESKESESTTSKQEAGE